NVEGMGKALLVGIHDDIDVTLPPARHGFRAMDARLVESKPGQCMFEAGETSLIQGKLDELDARADGLGGEIRKARNRRSRSPAEFVEHDDERSLTVHGDAACRPCPESVVKDFQGQETIKAGRMKGEHEIVDREIALPRKAAVMSA